MNASEVKSASNVFKRCPVCKIDLKGRFVYLDDHFEQLLSVPTEELYGKSIFEFIDKSSSSAIEHLLSQRNHYEKFYDTTTIVLLNHEQKRIPARIVASLNFISGNPVNFQLIIDPYQHPDRLVVVNDNKERYQEFVEKIILLDEAVDLPGIIEPLQVFSDARLVCLYEADDEELKLVQTAPFKALKDTLYSKALKLDKIHYEIYEKSGDYSPLDRETIKEAIENYGKAPDEFIKVIEDGSHRYLLRILYDENEDHADMARSITDIRNALDLIEKLSVPSQANLNESINIHFTVGFLETIGIGAALTDATGEIVGYNNKMAKLIPEKNLDGDYMALMNYLMNFNPKKLSIDVIEYITADVVEGQISQLHANIKINKTKSAELTVIKIGDTATDLTSCIVLAPF